MNNGFKYLLVVLFFQLVQINIYSQGTWERIESPTDQFLQSVYFIDSLYGWVVGDSGTIIHTSNGGADWETQDSKTENNIYDVFFLNRNLGWAPSWETSTLPAGTKLLKTTDGGQSWINPPLPEEDIFSQCVLFLDSLNGWMGGKPKPIVRTTDGGLSWTDAEIDSSVFSDLPVYDIQFYNSRFGYASGGVLDCCGIIWWTTDGGDYWYVLDTPYVAPEPIYQLHINDSINVLGVGGDFESFGFGVGMIRTSDGGVTWEFEYIGTSGVAWDIDFRTDDEAWSPLGGEQKLIYSLDSGSTWTRIPTPDSSMIFDIIFPDSLHGFAVGREGAIIKYIPPIINFVKEIEEGIPESFFLFQNYPNPFNPSTKIGFTIPTSPLNLSPHQGEGNRERLVVLKVYDVLGNEVKTLINREMPTGVYEVEFDASGLTAGIYFYTLSAGNFIKTKKMILLK